MLFTHYLPVRLRFRPELLAFGLLTMLCCIVAPLGIYSSYAATETPKQQLSANFMNDMFQLFTHMAALKNAERMPEEIENKAYELAQKPYEISNQVPESFNIDGSQWNQINFRPENALWKEERLPFEVQFFHPGFIYKRGVTINVVEEGKISKIPFSSSMFSYDDENLQKKAEQTQLDFAGFRLHFPINRPDVMDEVVVFLGATYFRAVGRNTQYGLASRAIALNTALPGGEEFPYFREFWLVKPAPDAESITIYALMDSPSMTGVFHFEITPGTSTVMDIDSTIFMRKNTQRPQKIALTPLNSMFLYSETGDAVPTDYRPEVHSSDGIFFTTGRNEWIWRPLTNPGRLAVNTFSLDNPQGFGLMQRDNDFNHYQDIRNHFERRPSVWVEPRSNWGAGHLELIEIPLKEAMHDNIIAFWVPDKVTLNTLAEQTQPAEKKQEYPDSMSYAYRLYWLPSGATLHELGQVVSTKMVKAPKEDTLRFIVDFESESLKPLSADTGLSSIIELPEKVQLVEKKLTKIPETGGWRLDFKVRLPEGSLVQNIIPSREGTAPLRFRALLKKGENLPDPLTEIWNYDFTY